MINLYSLTDPLLERPSCKPPSARPARAVLGSALLAR